MSQPQLSPESHDDPEKKKVLNLYALFGISLALTLVPMAVAAIVSLIFMTVVLIAAYVVRSRVEDHGLAGNHCTFIIRTIWIGALFSLITVGITSFFMIPRIDYTPFQPCADDMMTRGQDYLANMTQQQMMELSQPCMDAFINANLQTILTLTLLGAGPILIYFIYRFAKGLSRALKGYRMADPRAWF